MLKRFLAITTALVFVLCSTSTSLAEKSPLNIDASQPSVSPKILAKAKEWFHRFQTGNIDRSQLSDSVNRELTKAMIDQERAKLLPFGTPTSFEFINSAKVEGAVAYVFLLKFPSGRVVESIAYDGSGLIVGIDFKAYVRE